MGSWSWASPYESAVRCTSGPTPGARALLAWLLEANPGSASMGIFNCRNTRGGYSKSTHAEGRGIDLDPDGRRGGAGYGKGRALVARLGQHGARLGIQYVIYARQQWSAARPTGAYYGGVHPHYDHLHIELTRSAAAHLTLATCRAVMGSSIIEEEDVKQQDIDKIADAVFARIASKGLSVPTKEDIADRVWKHELYGVPAENRLHDADVRAAQTAKALQKHTDFDVPPEDEVAAGS